MTSKLVVNTIESDTGISSVSFASSISMNSTSKFHFSNAGIDIGADTNINRPAAGVLGFNISGGEKVRITSAGNLLIGKTADSGKPLEVYQAGDAAIRIQNNASGTGSNDGLLFEIGSSSKDALIWNYESANMRFGTAGTERLRITSAGDVGIGYDSPNVKLHVREGSSSASSYDNRYHMICESSGEAYLGFYVPSNQYAGIRFTDNTGLEGYIDYYFGTDDMVYSSTATHIFKTANSERLRITSGGQVRIGNASNLALWGQNNRLQVAGSGSWSDSGITIACMSTTGQTPNLVFGASRGATPGTALNNGDRLGYISFVGDDGTDMATVGAAIVAGTDAAPSSNSISGMLQFYTGGNSNVRLAINSNGVITKSYQPSFTAESTGVWGHGSSTGTLDIDINMVEEFDVGGNYNGQIFTAPVAGKYFFSYTFQYKCTSGYLQVELRKGVSGSYSSYGRMLVYPPQQSSLYSGPGIIGIMDLAAGNTVKPVAQVNYAGNQIQNVNFSGYLLG